MKEDAPSSEYHVMRKHWQFREFPQASQEHQDNDDDCGHDKTKWNLPISEMNRYERTDQSNYGSDEMLEAFRDSP